MNRPGDVDIQDAFERGTPIDEAMKQAGRDALLAHKRAGVPLVVWRDGRVHFVSPDEFEEEPEAPSTTPEPPQTPST